MKKLLALVLAVAMMLSLAAVSFAATSSPEVTFEFVGITEEPFHYDLVTYYADKFPGFYLVGDGDHLMMRNGYISYGAAAYYPIIFNNGNEDFIASDFDLIDNLKFKAEFEQGANLVKDISIVKMNVGSVVDTIFAQQYVAGNISAVVSDDADMLAKAVQGGENYLYFLKIGINPYITTGEEDVIGTVTFKGKGDDELDIRYMYNTGCSSMAPSRTDNGKVAKIENDIKCEINFPVHVERHYTAPTVGTITSDSFDVEYEKLYSLKFDNDEEVELTFGMPGDAMNEGRFTVDVSGQGKVVLNVTTTANDAIAAANPGAKMFFLNFNGVKFNRLGEFEYEMEDLAAAYRVVDNKLVPIPGLEIEDDTATFNTNMLVPYVFADKELVNP